MASLELNSIHVRYPVFSAGSQQSLFTAVARRATFGVLTRGGSATYVHALRGVTLKLRDGDRLGIVGRNGSGKSTLLKTLAGINWPQEGRRAVSGRISSIIALGAGLDGEKTGIENINFLCRLFDIPTSDIGGLRERVVEFADLGEYINLPTRTYSSGMLLRLSYGLALTLPGEILIVDEVIGAGDATFQRRAVEHTRAAFSTAKIFAMATHSGEALAEYCNQAIWMDRGRIVDFGEPREVWARYADLAPRYPEGVAAAR